MYGRHRLQKHRTDYAGNETPIMADLDGQAGTLPLPDVALLCGAYINDNLYLCNTRYGDCY
jgi:hypothetical protein